MTTGNLAKLREAIASTLEPLHPDELPNLCEVVGIPSGPPDGNPWNGKRRYVLTRLMPLTMPELVAVARAVGERIDSPDLAAAIPPAGVRGVDGELKNLIFAARGPKPRIVLRDAINNVIEIVEHADKCLVRPAATGARSALGGPGLLVGGAFA